MKYEEKLHNTDGLEPFPINAISEVYSIIDGIQLDMESDSIRIELSDEFRKLFLNNGWEQDTTLWFQEGRGDTPHYLKDRVLTQVSWRHYGFMGTELLKFQLDFEQDWIDAGVYICVTEELANLTKKIYRKRGKSPPFASSATHEKMCDYVDTLRTIIDIPLVIIGLLPA